MTNRRAYTLIEMVTILGILGMILSLISATIGTIYHIDASARRAMAATEALTSAELQLRHDAHAAASAELADDELTLHLPGGAAAVWTAEGNKLDRKLNSGNLTEQPQQWDFSRGTDCRWSLEDGDGRTWLTLTIARRDAGGRAAEAQIQCAVGRFVDHRPPQEPQP